MNIRRTDLSWSYFSCIYGILNMLDINFRQIELKLQQLYLQFQQSQTNYQTSMEYFQHLRLLFICLMAYLSYRHLNTSSGQPALQFSDQEDIEGTVNDQLEVSDQEEPLKEGKVCEDEQQPEEIVEEEESSRENLAASVTEMDQDVLCEVEENIEGEEVVSSDVLTPANENSITKIGKTKPIKKFWKKGKTQGKTQAVICSEDNQENVIYI